MTFMKKKFVDEYKWIDEDEMLDYTALAQSSPGAIAVNAAILVGRKVAGFAGMAAAVIGTVIPPMVILSIVSFFYNEFASNIYVAQLLKGMQAGVAAVITDVVISMGAKIIKSKSVFHIIIMAAAFCAVFFFKINVIYIILAAAICGTVSALFLFYKNKKNNGVPGNSEKNENTDGGGNEK